MRGKLWQEEHYQQEQAKPVKERKEDILIYAERSILRKMVESKGAICKVIRIKEKGKTIFIRLNNCKFDKKFTKGKSNSITSKKYFVDLN